MWHTQLRPALVALGLFIILSGVVYPLAVTGVAQLAFPWQANGSLIQRDGQTVGSALIGQSFTGQQYFWGRPSATSGYADNAAASGGSNLGPSNPDLAAAVAARVAELRRLDPENHCPVPVDLVTASGSGLDPQISPTAAEYQVARVARVRGLDEATVRRLVARATEKRVLGFLGEPRVNVLKLNLALDALAK